MEVVYTGCGVSIHGDTQSPSGHDPDQSALGGASGEGRVD